MRVHILKNLPKENEDSYLIASREMMNWKNTKIVTLTQPSFWTLQGDNKADHGE